MFVSVRSLSGNVEVLTGSGAGRILLGRLLALTPRPSEPMPIFLDFLEVEAATGSFLREGVVAYRDAVRRPGSLVYPIISNANETVIEDLEVVLALRNDALLACDLVAGAVTNVRVIGALEAKQALTYERLREAGEVDAVSLAREEQGAPGNPDPDSLSAKSSAGQGGGLVATKWNNRLAGLAAKGIAAEFAHGRVKRYRLAVMEGTRHGS